MCHAGSDPDTGVHTELDGPSSGGSSEIGHSRIKNSKGPRNIRVEVHLLVHLHEYHYSNTNTPFYKILFDIEMCI